MKSVEEWKYPIGKFSRKTTYTPDDLLLAVKKIKSLPEELHAIFSSLEENDLDQSYRPGGWSIRQLIHHMADSHTHAYLRSKFAFLNATPTIMDYNENLWATCSDAQGGPVAPSVLILEGIHQKWSLFFESLSSTDWKKTYQHPERKEPYTLEEVAALYSWHGEHHLKHISCYLEKFKK